MSKGHLVACASCARHVRGRSLRWTAVGRLGRCGGRRRRLIGALVQNESQATTFGPMRQTRSRSVCVHFMPGPDDAHATLIRATSSDVLTVPSSLPSSS